MKRIALSILAAATVASALPATSAFAQPYRGGGYDQRGPDRGPGYGDWRSINDRQAELDRRIDQGVRDGSLSRREAVRLRTEFRNIARLEARYRASRPGLTRAERADLDARFDRLSAQIRYERHDRNNYRR